MAKTTKRFAGFARGADDAVVPSPAQQRPSQAASCTTQKPPDQGRQLHHATMQEPPGQAANPLTGAARAQLNGDAYLSATLATKTYWLS